MTAPQAPAAEKATHKPEIAPIAEAPERNRVDELASLSGLLPIAGSDLTFLDPGQVITLQKTAGNHAVNSLLQRSPTDAPPKPPPKLKGRRRGRPVPQMPMDPPSTLFDTIDDMPWLVDSISHVVEEDTERSRRKGFQPDIVDGSVSAAVIFARDAVFFFNSSATLYAVESNLDGEVSPDRPQELPKPKFTLPNENMILVSEPSTGRSWRVFAMLRKELGDDDEAPEVIGLHLVRTESKPHLPPGFRSGELVVSVYVPARLAARSPVPHPGWKAKQGPAKEQPKETPAWAKSKYARVQKLLAAPDGDDEAEKAPPQGTGLGMEGTGPGGGGTGTQGVPGARAGVAPVPDQKVKKPATKGRIVTKKRRAKPDKVALFQGDQGPLLNVWEGKSHQTIPLKPGEPDRELKQRIEEAAGKQVSTGQTLAEAVTETGFTGGQGQGRPTLEQILEATEFTANAAEYPSKMEMQGGSGAEVSPSGWATTITGGKHKFDMILDYDARNFGLANQVFARLGFIDYYWQVIDISGMDPGAGALRARGETESREDFDLEMRKRARVAALNQDRAREVGEFEGLKEDVSDMASNKWEDAKEDLWASKAQGVGLVALDAAWNIGKALLSAFISKMTEPENRQEIAFAKPGEYLIRCLANPQPNKDAPLDKQTRRATSIAVFPVRVVDVNKRALEVTRQDATQLKQAQYLFTQMQAKLDADPKNESLRAAVRIAKREAGLSEAKYKYTASEKAESELADFDKQIAVLEKLADAKKGLQPIDLPGEERTIGLQLKDDVLKRWGRSGGIAAWYEYQYQIEDVKKARKQKAEQKAIADKKASQIAVGSEMRPRPRVTFVSEENGALVKMDMVLGRTPGSSQDKPRWILADVTTEKTSRSYNGKSDKSGTEGDAEAIKNAFREFCDKAEYGRGTIAIDLPGNATLIPSGTTMLMKPGEAARWKARLDSLVEIAGLVAPYVKGGQLIGRVIAAYGALGAAEKLYDRAVNDRLKANFETLTDVVAVLAPMAQGATKLVDKLGRSTKGAYVLQTFAKTADVANEFMMPATFVNDLDKIVKDKSMGGPEREAAIVMLFGRGLRDGTVQYVKVTRSHRAGGDQLAPGSPDPSPTGPPATAVGVATPAGGAPTTKPIPAPDMGATGTAARPPVGEGAPSAPTPIRAPTARRADVDKQFDVSDVTPVEPARRRDRGESSEMPPDPTRPAIRLPEAEGGPSPKRAGDGPEAAPGTEKARKTNIEIIQQETRADARAKARAAEFAPLFFKWKDLHTVQRQKQLEQLINAHLASEGVPRIIVDPIDVRAGNASFRFQEWRIHISEHSLNNKNMTPDKFAELVDNATHEARHAVHHYRGLRIAIREGRHNSDAKIHQPIVAAARKANRQGDPRKEMSEEAYGEAKEIYEVTHLADQRQAKIGGDALNREAVLNRKDVTRDSAALAAKKLNELEAQGKKGTREYADALADHRIALREAQNAHDGYVGLPQETDAGRYGSSVRKATAERLALMMRVNGAKLAREQAAQAARDARRIGDRADMDAAAQAYLAAHKRALVAQAELDGLVSKEPREVGGRVMTQEIPADPNLGRRTGASEEPGAGAGERLRPGEVRLPPREHGRGDESSPPPGAEPDAPDAARTADTTATRPSAGAGMPAAKAPKAAPMLPGSEVPADLGKAARPTIEPKPADMSLDRGRDLAAQPHPRASIPDAEYAPDQPGRYVRTGDKPVSGVSQESNFVVKDSNDGTLHLFKPTAGEKPVDRAEDRGIRAGEQAPREVGAHMAAEALGVPSVKARLVTIDGIPGVLVEWRAQNTLMDLRLTDPPAFMRLITSEKFKQAMRGLDALDYLINNLDRSHNWGNYLYEFLPDGTLKLTAIDHGLTFTSTKDRADIVGWTRELPDAYSSELAGKLRDLSANRAEFIDKLKPFVGDEAIPGVLQRLDAMVKDMESKEQASK